MRKLIFISAALLLIDLSSSAITVTSVPSSSICLGSSTNISAMASGGTGPYSFVWMPGSLPGSSVSVSPTTNTTYTVTGTDAVGATATSTVTITVLPLPSVAYTSSATSGCAPFCTNFSDLSTISSGTITAWNWNFGDGSFPDVVQNPTHCYSTSGMYDVYLTATSTAGCSSTTVITQYITVYPNPIANFSSSQLSATTVSFTDLSSVDALSWSWDFGDGNFSSLQNPVHAYSAPGSYNVQLTVQNAYACMNTNPETILVTDINEYYLSNLVSISPNPLNAYTTIELKNTKLNLLNMNLILFDVLGKEVKKIELDNYKTTIEKGDLNTGIYFYKVMNDNQIISTGKLAVE